MRVGPREVPVEARWRPAKADEALNSRYRELLAARGLDVPADAEFPVRAPERRNRGAPLARLRARLSRLRAVGDERPTSTLGGSFSQRRYVTPSAFSAAYGVGVELDEHRLPDRLPPDGAPLLDWINSSRS